MRLRMGFVTLALVVVPTAALAQDSKSHPPMDGSTHTVKLQDVRTRTDEVKAELRRIHSQLAGISDQVFRTESGATGFSGRGEIRFKNEMSGAYRLVHVTVLMDGKPLYEKEGDTLASLPETGKDLPVFTGALVTGDHILTLQLTFKGNGYGVFYLEGYTFNVKSTHAITVGGTGPVNIVVVSYEKGDMTTPLELRPAVEWRETVARK